MDVGFDYGSSGSRGHERSGRNRTRGNDESQQQQQQTTTTAPVSSVRGTRLTDSDFPGINGQPASQQQQQPNSTSNRRQQKSAFRKPAGFGALSDNWPTLGQSSSSNDNASSFTQQQKSSPSSSSSSTTTADANKPAPAPEIVSRHTAFMERVFDMLKSHDKLGRFRSLTTAYRNSNIDVDTYVNEVVELCDGNNENSGKIFKGVEDLMDNQEKKWEIVRAWRDKQTSVCLFF